jgi:CRISPR/Cas system-associated endoribonuclease Cas2
MKTKIKQAIIQTYIGKEIQLCELDLSNRDIVLGKKWDDEKFEYPQTFIKTKKGSEEQYSFRGQADPVCIEVLIEVLEKLKDKGCDFVEIVNHCDHHGYHINGLKLHKATQEEIEKYEKEAKDKDRILAQKRVKELQDEIDQITKKYIDK